MKNKSDIQQELDDILKTLSDPTLRGELKPSQISKLEKQKEKFKQLILYVETLPTKEFLEKEIQRLENKITLLMNQFDLSHPDQDKLSKPAVSKLRKAHESQHNIPAFREQVRTLRYLLD